MKAYRYKYVAILITTLIATCIYFFSKPEDKYFRISSVVWTTEYHITYKGNCDMTDSINRVFNAIDNTLSVFNPKSTISRINANDPTVKPHPYVTDLISRSIAINRQSEGYYDPTVAPLVNLWGFGTKKESAMPTKEQIKEALQYVGINNVKIDNKGNVVKQHKQTIINLSSIAKGFACDEIGRMFLRNGIDNYIIEIGGEICMHGANPQGEEWHVSIDRPIESNDSVIHESAIVLRLTNKGLATSGNYRNYHEVNGKTFSHIINPTTGYPENSDVLSATIIASNTADADAYATACIAMGAERSMRMIQADKDICALLIYMDKHGEIKNWLSHDLQQMIVKQ